MDDLLELEKLTVSINDKLNKANFEVMGSIELSALRRELEDLHSKNLTLKNKLRFDQSVDTADYDEYSRESEKIWEFVQRRLPPVIEAQRNRIHAAQDRLKKKREIELLQKFNAENIKNLEAELEKVTANYNNAGAKELKEVYEVPMKALQKAIEKCKKLFVKYDKELATLKLEMDILMKGGEMPLAKPKRKYTRRKKTDEVKKEVKKETKEAVKEVVVAEEKVEKIKEEKPAEPLKEEPKEEPKVEEKPVEKEEEKVNATKIEEPKEKIIVVTSDPVVEPPKEEPKKEEPKEEPKVEEKPVEVVYETREEHAQKFADNLPPLLPGMGETTGVSTPEEVFEEEPKTVTNKKSTGLFERVTPVIPKIKGRNTRLAKKVITAAALTVGVGGVAYLVAGPLGLGIAAGAALAGKKLFDKGYEKFKEAKITSLGGSLKVEKIDEPSESVLSRIKDIKEFLSTEEGKKKFEEIVNERINNHAIFEDFADPSKKFKPTTPTEVPVAPVVAPIEKTVVYTPSEGGMKL